MKQFCRHTMVAILALFYVATAAADWQLDSDRSALHFVSVKNNSIGELHSFKQLTGSLSKAGKLNIDIKLASVETGIDIRNERMKEHLFAVDLQPSATVAAEVDIKMLKKLKKSRTKTLEVPFSLSLNGKTKDMSANFTVTKLKSGYVQVSSTAPILVNAADFGLMPGIDKLKQLAGLSSIVRSVPVTIQLMFKKV